MLWWKKEEHKFWKSCIMVLDPCPLGGFHFMLSIDYTQKLLNLQGVLVKKVTSDSSYSRRNRRELWIHIYKIFTSIIRKSDFLHYFFQVFCHGLPSVLFLHPKTSLNLSLRELSFYFLPPHRVFLTSFYPWSFHCWKQMSFLSELPSEFRADDTA